ncbi:MAG: RNA polymerase sigma factor [Acidobacteriaceae bacterium]
MQQSGPPTRWTLDQRSLNHLLNALHPDRDQACQIYQALRERLTRFFLWNHAATPEELADETLDRLARRLSQPEMEVLDPLKFAAGIARLLLKEHLRHKDRQEQALAIMAQSSFNSEQRQLESALQEERVAILEECLQTIPAPNRTLFERYFSSQGHQQIQHRQRLAQELGISLNALRNRVMRIRAELERTYEWIYFKKNPPLRKINPQRTSHYDE